MDGEYIVGIYDYFDSSDVNEPAYYFVYLFDSEARLDSEIFEDSYRDILLKTMKSEFNDYIGPFENLSELNQYAYSLCEKAGCDWIGLISIKDYSDVLSNLGSVDDFREKFGEKLNIMENLNQKQGSIGILKRLFT